MHAVGDLTDPFMGVPSAIHIVNVNLSDREAQSDAVVKRIEGTRLLV